MAKNMLDESIERLLTIQKHLAAIPSREDGSHRREMIQHRRALANELVELSNTAAADPRLKGDAALEARFRQSFSAMRTATALHQSKWPAIDVDPENPRYIESTQTVRKTNKDFADWAASLPKT